MIYRLLLSNNSSMMNSVPAAVSLRISHKQESSKNLPVMKYSRDKDAKSQVYSSKLCLGKKNQFVMVKIGKTGTSTLFALLSRFVRNNQLNLLVPNPNEGVHIDWQKPGLVWQIGPKKIDRADVLIHHARYNRSIFDRHIQKDFKLIVPVREPTSWIKSAIKYYSNNIGINGRDPNKIIRDDNILFKNRTARHAGLVNWFHIPFLQWLGFDYNQRKNMTAIKEFIKDAVSRIDLPILNEKFDASLIILKKRFCWEYSDIFYVSQNKGSSSTLSLSEDSIKKVLSKEVNLGDKMLYDAVSKLWWSQPELKETGFWKECKCSLTESVL
ncbi:hypothetical protein EB796_024720 [Bugula neritina]|uniref:Uncharacterized protein n=1 Tax=Bugula neritina TaxID=10212 RepID=A0A7J7ITT3_BUGNE|nr:hypothetical protein EB796_024720 [Bugula neritina]